MGDSLVGGRAATCAVLQFSGPLDSMTGPVNIHGLDGDPTRHTDSEEVRSEVESSAGGQPLDIRQALSNIEANVESGEANADAEAALQIIFEKEVEALASFSCEGPEDVVEKTTYMRSLDQAEKADEFLQIVGPSDEPEVRPSSFFNVEFCGYCGDCGRNNAVLVDTEA